MSEKIIEIQGLSYAYPDGTPALTGIDLDIDADESVGLIGPNGSGKTTLLLHLNGILRGSGCVRICGLGMADMNLPEIRSKVGLVFQDPDNQLFMPTVFDDVAFGPINMNMSKDEVCAAVDRSLAEVDMAALKDRAAHHLSFGEQKRVSIATVLSMQPEILAMDEPTSNLDPKHRRSLIQLINSLQKTKLIATHDLDLVLETCRRVFILNKGAVVAQGPAQEILRDRYLLEAHDLELPVSLQKIPPPMCP